MDTNKDHLIALLYNIEIPNLKRMMKSIRDSKSFRRKFMNIDIMDSVSLIYFIMEASLQSNGLFNIEDKNYKFILNIKGLDYSTNSAFASTGDKYDNIECSRFGYLVEKVRQYAKRYYGTEIIIYYVCKYTLANAISLVKIPESTIKFISNEINSYYKEESYIDVANKILSRDIFHIKLLEILEELDMDIDIFDDIDKTDETNYLAEVLKIYHTMKFDYTLYEKNMDSIIKMYINQIAGG